MKRRSRWQFWDRVQQLGEGDCWLWLGCTNGLGYGQVKAEGRLWYPHRLAYESVHGDISKEQKHLEVMHTCYNRLCCNPSHLILGTHAENMFMSRGRGKTQLWLKKMGAVVDLDRVIEKIRTASKG